jgi:hypothetical protein
MFAKSNLINNFRLTQKNLDRGKFFDYSRATGGGETPDSSQRLSALCSDREMLLLMICRWRFRLVQRQL